jgi:hypothetical protein
MQRRLASRAAGDGPARENAGTAWLPGMPDGERREPEILAQPSAAQSFSTARSYALASNFFSEFSLW